MIDRTTKNPAFPPHHHLSTAYCPQHEKKKRQAFAVTCIRWPTRLIVNTQSIIFGSSRQQPCFSADERERVRVREKERGRRSERRQGWPLKPQGVFREVVTQTLPEIPLAPSSSSTDSDVSLTGRITQGERIIRRHPQDAKPIPMQSNTLGGARTEGEQSS